VITDRVVPVLSRLALQERKHALRERLTWTSRHGLIRYAMIAGSKLGDLHCYSSIDPGVRDDPYPFYEQARQRGGIVPGSLTTMAVSHGAVSKILRDNRFQVGLDLPGVPKFLRRALTRGEDGIVGPIDKPSLLAVNPPQHTRYRRQVSGVFGARAIAAMEPEIRATARTLIAEMAAQANPDPGPAGGVPIDLVEHYSALLPVTVILDILGIPREMRDQFIIWGNSAAMSLDTGLTFEEYQACEAGVLALNDWMYGHIDRLRAEPGDDLLSRLIQVEDDGVRMNDLELMATINLLIAAGFETTVNLVSAGALLLSQHREQLAQLQQDASGWDNAVDEILRYDAPVQETVRIVTENVEVEGVRLKKGTFIGVMLGAANQDPVVFRNPRAFDINRPNARDHLAFSLGIHHCVGAALARLEGKVALEELFAHYPDLKVTGPLTWRKTRSLRGLEHLPVRLGAPAKVDLTTFDVPAEVAAGDQDPVSRTAEPAAGGCPFHPSSPAAAQPNES
jgi:cytochrome P450